MPTLLALQTLLSAQLTSMLSRLTPSRQLGYKQKNIGLDCHSFQILSFLKQTTEIGSFKHETEAGCDKLVSSDITWQPMSVSWRLRLQMATEQRLVFFHQTTRNIFGSKSSLREITWLLMLKQPSRLSKTRQRLLMLLEPLLEQLQWTLLSLQPKQTR